MEFLGESSVSPHVQACPDVSETLSTAYAAEVCPLALRGYLTSFVNMCWGFGLFLAAGVVRASIEVDSQWGKFYSSRWLQPADASPGWRLPYMLQWIWPVPLFCAALAGPESKINLYRAKTQLTTKAPGGWYEKGV